MSNRFYDSKQLTFKYSGMSELADAAASPADAGCLLGEWE